MHYVRAEERLVRFCMEDWQRRGMNFLQVGLHSSLIPEFFWDCGFDVTCCEENHQAVEKACLRSGPRISYQIGKADSLPFDDDSFEYAFLPFYAEQEYVQEFGMPSFLLHTDKNTFLLLMRELCRVARLGVILLAKNRFSFCHVSHIGKTLNPYSVWNFSKELCPKGRVRFASTGYLPRIVASKLSLLNNSVTFMPFGALIGYGLQFNAMPLTGIGAFIKQEKCKLGEISAIQRSS